MDHVTQGVPFPACVRVNAASSFQTFTYTPQILHKNSNPDPNIDLVMLFLLMVTQSPFGYRFSGDKILLLMVALPYGK